MRLQLMEREVRPRRAREQRKSYGKTTQKSPRRNNSVSSIRVCGIGSA